MTVHNPYKYASFYQNFIADIFIYRLSYTNGTMKTTFAILGIIAAVGLLVSMAAPSAFALTQGIAQGSSQTTIQGQGSLVNLGSPQTSISASSQSATQNACVFVVAFCG